MDIRTRPFDHILSMIIFKITGGCNLDCPGCFMFDAADQSHILRPKLVSRDVVDQTTTAIETYLNEYGINTLEIVLHGGEPLLLGKENLVYLLEALRRITNSERLSLSIQTNGTQIDREFIDIFRQYRVRVGVSMDGGPDVMAISRPVKNGKNSYDDTVRGIRLLQEHLGDEFFRGLLAVVRLYANPAEVYHHFRALGITRMDFLLPLRNHAYPGAYKPESMQYATWLGTLLDCYLEEDNPEVDIRIFRSIIDLLIGAESPMAAIRHSAIDICVIETNGSIELVDDLRICGEDFTNLHLNVATNKINEFFSHPRVLEMLEAERHPPAQCNECKHFNICGSGGHAFRYGSDRTYNHPSIYCEETLALIERIKLHVGASDDE